MTLLRCTLTSNPTRLIPVCHLPSPGPSSSFIFILTLGDTSLFLLLLRSHEARSQELVLRWKQTHKKKNRTNIYIRGPFLIFRKAKAVSPPLTTWLVSIATAGGWGGRVCLSMQPVLKCWSLALPGGGAIEFANRTPFPSQPPLVTMVPPCFNGGLNQKRLGTEGGVGFLMRDKKCFCRYLLTVTTGNTTRKRLLTWQPSLSLPPLFHSPCFSFSILVTGWNCWLFVSRIPPPPPTLLLISF